MDIDKDIYHSNGMLGLVPVVDESEAMSFYFGKLLTTTSDSKDFFNCDNSIGLEYPTVRSALQPICVHVDGAESTNWVNPPCDENVDLLDISSKRLPVDLGCNGLDKSSIYSSSSSSSTLTNGSYSSSNLTPNNHVISNSLPPASEIVSPEISDYYSANGQFNESYNGMRNDYGNHQTPFGEHEKLYYNGNQSLYSNGYHSQQPYDHTNHHIHHAHHLANHPIYHNANNHLHHHHHHQQPTTPLHHYQQQKRGQQPFQRQYTHRRRLNLYEKTSPSPTKLKQKHQNQQPQSPVLAQKPPKQPKSQKSPLIQRPQKSPKIQHQKSQLQAKPQLPPPPPAPLPNSKSDQKQFVIKRKQRTHVKSLEVKPELNQRPVLKKKLGRPRKYDYSPPKPTKFRSPRLRLKVQSEDVTSDDGQDSGDQPKTERKVQEKVKKVKEVLPCDWVRPDNLTFDRHNVSDYEKTSLPEFFAGKFDRTHFHPSQYLQIRNIFLDEWDKRKPNSVNFREMIRVHKGIGNVVSFSRVCKFLTAIGAINEISQDDDDDDEDENDNDDVTKGSGDKEKNSSTVTDEDQSKSQDDGESANQKESTSTQSSPLSLPSELPTPPPSSPERQTNSLSSTTQSEEKSSQPVTSPPPRRKGRKRKSYFLNEMTRLGIDPLSAGFQIPGYDRDKQDDDDDCEQTTPTPTDVNDDQNQSENVSQKIIQN